jgi:hypothetical protein
MFGNRSEYVKTERLKGNAGSDVGKLERLVTAESDVKAT